MHQTHFKGVGCAYPNFQETFKDILRGDINVKKVDHLRITFEGTVIPESLDTDFHK